MVQSKFSAIHLFQTTWYKVFYKRTVLLCFACKFYCTTQQIHLQSVPCFLAAVLVIWNLWFCLCLCVLLLYLKKKKRKKNVSLINNHWISFLLLFQQLMPCNLYNELDTGLKFDSMSHSPWYWLHYFMYWYVLEYPALHLLRESGTAVLRALLRVAHYEKCTILWALLRVVCVCML